ncbi:MAG: PorV/PorQ family protein [Candidatus Kapabacteria bacterium]|nr:PorV/PorQ family protein [Candidatus Kapabacteria bacterium]MDW8012452.1 PorV/PorQ family protein [Bacteroidota bacterium]
MQPRTLWQSAIIVLLGVASSSAQLYAPSAGEFKKVGAAGSQFLKLPIGARAVGLGGSAGAVNDLTAIYWNPAGVGDITGISGHFSHTQWFGGFSHNFAAVAVPLGENFRLAGSFISFASGDIPVTTLEQPEGTGATYTISDVAVGVTFGGRVTEQFSFGVTGRFVQNSLLDVSATGVTFDVGTFYQTDFYGLRLGFSVHNLGPNMEYSGQGLYLQRRLIDALNSDPTAMSIVTNPYAIPLMFRAGIAFDALSVIQGRPATAKLYSEGHQEHRLIAALDFETYSDVPEQFAVGAEYTWNDLLSVRAGYRFGNDQMWLSGGVGVRYVGSGFRGQLDYALTPTRRLGLVNRLSLTVTLE